MMLSDFVAEIATRCGHTAFVTIHHDDTVTAQLATKCCGRVARKMFDFNEREYAPLCHGCLQRVDEFYLLPLSEALGAAGCPCAMECAAHAIYEAEMNKARLTQDRF